MQISCCLAVLLSPTFSILASFWRRSIHVSTLYFLHTVLCCTVLYLLPPGIADDEVHRPPPQATDPAGDLYTVDDCLVLVPDLHPPAAVEGADVGRSLLDGAQVVAAVQLLVYTHIKDIHFKFVYLLKPVKKQ